jgi:tetratricopeptide (TPR) repeat protein
MKYFLTIAKWSLWMLCLHWNIYGQEPEEAPTDDLGNVTDAFQENFFEALKQKGIENYELALEALKRAHKSTGNDPTQEAVINYEMAKNLTSLKRYDEADESFQKVLATTGDRMDVLESLYDLYYQQRNYEAAIPLVQKLIKKDDDYKEDLANLYHRTKRYNQALELLDELDESWGESVYRDSLRKQIYQITGNKEGAIQDLESKIDKNPKKEQDYLNLIYLYSQEGDTEKAFSMALSLLKELPNATKVHLALYKFYLEKEEIPQAIHSIQVIFESTEIEEESKLKVLSDYLNFVSDHPEYDETVEDLLPILLKSEHGDRFEQIGNYFMSKGNHTMALKFYEEGIRLDEDNFSLLKNTILLEIDSGKFTEAASLSENGLAIFPAQALLYLLNGVANNKLNDPEKAIISLEMGIDFLLDDPKMERDFYIQLAEAYRIKGELTKAAEWNRRAAQIQISN